MSQKNITACAVCLVLLACSTYSVILTSSTDAADATIIKETKEHRDQRMKWWREARFGMFIHWGLYAVPAGEWNGKRIKGIGEWIMNRAKIPIPEYEKLVPKFNPVKFNAKEWARIAKNAGQKYMVITSKHHDGFCLFDSKLTDYDIMSTPFKRDVMKELAEACKEEGIKLCFYHSIMDWHHPDAKGKNFPKYKEHMFGQVRELLTNYGPIGVMWFDGDWIKEWDQKQGRDLVALCRKLQPNIIINNRVGKRNRNDGDFGTPEQRIPATGIPGYDWETCMTMNNTWGYKYYDHNWKSTEDLIHKLVDIVSKGGNFLLNVGPTAEGIIPQPSVQRLREIGQWLNVNGESIYGATASPFKRLAWGRCTSKPERLYLHVFDWPKEQLDVLGLDNNINKAYLLADAKRVRLKVTQADGRVSIDVPAKAPDKIDAVIVLEIEGEPKVAGFIVRQSSDGDIALKAADATVHGETARYEVGGGKDNIGFWTNTNDYVNWDFMLKKPGTFAVEITFACAKGSGGSEYILAVGDLSARAQAGQTLTGAIKDTGSWTNFVTEKLGPIKLAEPRKYTLSIKPKTKPGLAVMNLKSVVLRPIPE